MKAKYVKKTIMLNQENINRASKLLNAKTEKETVNRALEIIVEEENIINVHREIGGAGNIGKIF
jgi:hypothetical protein